MKSVGWLFLISTGCGIAWAATLNPAGVDINQDRVIDIADMGVFLDSWLSHSGPSDDWNPACDLSNPPDGVIDTVDLLKLSSDWLVVMPDPNAFICPADINQDRLINIRDYSLLAAVWRSDSRSLNWNAACDIADPADGVIDEQDLLSLAINWLNSLPDPNDYVDLADVNLDGIVDLQDYSRLSLAWLSDDQPPVNWNPACDLAQPANGRVDQGDFAAFSCHWHFRIPDPNHYIFIPGGRFDMGDHHDFMPEARPVHAVNVESFYMAKYPVTNQQFCEFLNDAMLSGELKVQDGLVYAADDAENAVPWFGTNAVNEHSRIAYSTGQFTVVDKPDHPVVQVNWYGAVVYCNWLSRRHDRPACHDLTTWQCDFSKRAFRLPTEAEWEYAARGGENLAYYRYCWGDEINGSHANYHLNGSPFASTTPVGYFDGNQIPSGVDMANAFGLYDMAGNVQEWCNDWYAAGYYAVSPVENPKGPEQGISRVLRGGSWNNPEKNCRVAYRDSYHEPLSRSGSYGFRVCLPVPAGD